MNLSSPISSVIPSLDGPVYSVLVGTLAPLSLTEVHQIGAVGSASGVRRSLRRMVSAGLVHEVPGGYVLNRAHLATSAIEVLANLYGELANRIRDVFENWDGDVLLAGYFGSVARRDGNEQSDVDLLIVSDAPNLNDLRNNLGEEIHAWTGNEAHIIALSSEELIHLRNAQEPIVANWQRELSVISGDRRVLSEHA